MEIITQETLKEAKEYDSQKATLQYYLDYLGLHDIHEEGVRNADVKQILKEMRTMGYACSERQLRYTSQIMNNKCFQPLYATDTQHPNDARYIVGITGDQAVVMNSQRHDLNDKYTYIIYPPKYGDTLLEVLSEVVKKQIVRNSNIDKEDIDKVNEVIASDMEHAILGANAVGGKPNIGDIQKSGGLKRQLYHDNGVVKQRLVGDIELENKTITFEVSGEERQQEYNLRITEQTKHKWLLGLETSNMNSVNFTHLEHAIDKIRDTVRDRLGIEVATPKYASSDILVDTPDTKRYDAITDIIQQNTAIDPYKYDVKQGTRRIYEEMLSLTEYDKASSKYTIKYQYYDQEIKGVIRKDANIYHLIEEDIPVTQLPYRYTYNNDADLNYLLSRINGCDTEYVSQGYAEGLREQRKRVMESPGETITPNIAIGGPTEGITLQQSFRRQIYPTYISQHLSGQYSDSKRTMVVFADQQEDNNYNVVIAVQDNKKRAQIQDEDKRQIKCRTIDDVDKSFAQGIGVREDVEAVEYYEGISIHELVAHVAEAQKTLYGIEIQVKQHENLDLDDIDWSFAKEDNLER